MIHIIGQKKLHKTINHMIKFFRRIRKKFLEENRLSKYLVYAGGEIILVMIGILLALQVNNWNENRKDRAQEQQYYCSLYEEIKQDKEQLQSLKTLTQERIDGINIALTEVQKDDPDMTMLGKNWLIGFRLTNRTFLPSNGTYQEIKSTGKLSIIRDQKVIKRLNTYFKNVSGYTQTILYNSQLDIDAIDKIDSWFETGIIHANMESFYTDDVFTPEIRDQLRRDLPERISESSRAKVYNALVLCGINNRRRLELLQLIEQEVDKMKSLLEPKCKLNQ